MNVSNRPTDRPAVAGDGPQPLLSYATILQEMSIAQSDVEVGAALAQQYAATPWPAVWSRFPTTALDELGADTGGPFGPSPENFGIPNAHLCSPSEIFRIYSHFYSNLDCKSSQPTHPHLFYYYYLE